MANLFKYSIALFLILTSSFLAKAQYIEAEQCIGGEGLDEIYVSLKTKEREKSIINLTLENYFSKLGS